MALESMGCGRPSHIQAAALRDWRDVSPAAGAATVICDAAGSGKTLAYLVPLIQVRSLFPKALGAVLGVCRIMSAVGYALTLHSL